MTRREKIIEIIRNSTDAGTASGLERAADAILSLPPDKPATDKLVRFLEEAAVYFETRDIKGEDRAYWANVNNAAMCRKAAIALDTITKPVTDETAKAALNEFYKGALPSSIEWSLHLIANMRRVLEQFKVSRATPELDPVTIVGVDHGTGDMTTVVTTELAKDGTLTVVGIETIDQNPSWPIEAQFRMGDTVAKKGRTSWRGRVVGWYRTELTALGYAIESHYETGSVQIYPETALVPWNNAR